MGRGYPDEASIEGVEPTPSSTQRVSTACTGSWVHVEQLAGSDARYFLGNLQFIFGRGGLRRRNVAEREEMERYFCR